MLWLALHSLSSPDYVVGTQGLVDKHSGGARNARGGPRSTCLKFKDVPEASSNRRAAVLPKESGVRPALLSTALVEA